MKSKNQIRRERKKQKHTDAQAVADNKESSPKPIEEATQHPRSSITMLARKYDWIAEDDPMYGLYKQVSSRFKRGREDDDDGSEESSSEAKDAGQIGATEDSKKDSEGEEIKISRKQLRKDTKPPLAELKKQTSRPELVEWYDCDAAHPSFLVYMKTLPNVVQVPPNWRHRLEIPQFGNKPTYELPRNIADTNIQEAKKGDRLDVDYERMHSAFFSPDVEGPRLNLLPYGQVVDLKLRRAYKPPTASKAQKGFKKPPAVSEKLRKALGIKEGDPLPWEEAVKKMGVAPGYAHVLSSKSSSDEGRWGAMKY